MIRRYPDRDRIVLLLEVDVEESSDGGVWGLDEEGAERILGDLITYEVSGIPPSSPQDVED